MAYVSSLLLLLLIVHRGNLEESIKSNREEGTTVVGLGREGERGVKRGKGRERNKLERRVFEADG